MGGGGIKGDNDMRIESLICAAMLFGTAAIADPSAPPITPGPEAQAAAECPDSSDSCKLVCKKFDPPTGTRLGGHIECRTKQWWENRMREDQATITKIQENSFKQKRPGDDN